MGNKGFLVPDNVQNVTMSQRRHAILRIFPTLPSTAKGCRGPNTVSMSLIQMHPLIGKDLTLYRIGKHSNPQNRPKIRKKDTQKKWIFGIFGVFFSYFACGAVFLFCRGPSFSQPIKRYTSQSPIKQCIYMHHVKSRGGKP